MDVAATAEARTTAGLPFDTIAGVLNSVNYTDAEVGARLTHTEPRLTPG